MSDTTKPYCSTQQNRQSTATHATPPIRDKTLHTNMMRFRCIFSQASYTARVSDDKYVCRVRNVCRVLRNKEYMLIWLLVETDNHILANNDVCSTNATAATLYV